MSAKTWILSLLGLGAATGGGIYLLSLSNFSKKAVIEQSISFSSTGQLSLPTWASSILSQFKISIPTNIIMTINVTVKNPTNTQLTISQPFVQIWLQPDRTQPSFVSSDQSNVQHTIPKLGQVNFDPINLTISVAKLATAFPNLVSKFASEKKLTIYTRTTSYVNKSIATVKDDEQTFSL